MPASFMLVLLLCALLLAVCPPWTAGQPSVEADGDDLVLNADDIWLALKEGACGQLCSAVHVRADVRGSELF